MNYMLTGRLIFNVTIAFCVAFFSSWISLFLSFVLLFFYVSLFFCWSWRCNFGRFSYDVICRRRRSVLLFFWSRSNQCDAHWYMSFVYSLNLSRYLFIPNLNHVQTKWFVDVLLLNNFCFSFIFVCRSSRMYFGQSIICFSFVSSFSIRFFFFAILLCHCGWN